MLQDIGPDVNLIAALEIVAGIADVVFEAGLGLDSGIGDMHRGPALATLHYPVQIIWPPQLAALVVPLMQGLLRTVEHILFDDRLVCSFSHLPSPADESCIQRIGYHFVDPGSLPPFYLARFDAQAVQLPADGNHTHILLVDTTGKSSSPGPPPLVLLRAFPPRYDTRREESRSTGPVSSASSSRSGFSGRSAPVRTEQRSRIGET